MNIPKNDYPRPQLAREQWINLNGTWDFFFDFGKTGEERKIWERPEPDRRILVPFCPESKLSGVEYKDFMNAVWYRRSFTLPETAPGSRVLLHFEAVDYRTVVRVNDAVVGRHLGGYTPFTLDITDAAHAGENLLVVCAEDDCREPLCPRGKQSEKFFSNGCDYTRTTGIWQTVWLEIVPACYLADYRCTTDIENGAVSFDLSFGACGRKQIAISVSCHGEPMGEANLIHSGTFLSCTLPLKETRLWAPGDPQLYDVVFTVTGEDGQTDTVTGYFGMRSVELNGGAVCINGKPVFLRTVLDQGFYPDGVYTAPSDDDLRHDIELSMAVGFNGARLHQRVFERRFLYWADRLGYLVFGEYGSWGLDLSNPAALETFLPPWLESVARDRNSPALIGWCPFNETWDYEGRRQDNAVLAAVYDATKAADPTRPVIDTSGNYHVKTDIFDIHDYEQDVEKFAAHYEPMRTGDEVYNWCKDRQQYGGQPYFVSEYGGIQWSEQGNGWGYGKAPKTQEEYTDRFVGLTAALLSHPKICGLCYTQLYDIEQEQNGIYTYARKAKFPPALMERMRAAMAAPAAIEQE